MKSVYDWAKEYTGDPESHERRGTLILDFLEELGLDHEDHVWNLGCGALSEGEPLIWWLRNNCFTGTDPNGWLIEAALGNNPNLRNQSPIWGYASDFTAPGGPFDFVVSHSVLSHVAHWQMEQALSNVRRQVPEGAKWLASLRIDQYDSFSRDWVYPGNSKFRFATVQALAYYFGWHTEIRHDFRERMVESCPNDLHDWLVFTAVPSSAELNDKRLQLEAERREHDEIVATEEAAMERLELARIKDLEEEMQAKEEE